MSFFEGVEIVGILSDGIAVEIRPLSAFLVVEVFHPAVKVGMFAPVKYLAASSGSLKFTAGMFS